MTTKSISKTTINGQFNNGRGWSAWQDPNEDDIFTMTKIITKHVYFLKPEIIKAVVEDNELRKGLWQAQLESLRINPDSYLWDKGCCVFPGVRRYKNQEQRGTNNSENGNDALYFDDNDFPKQLWAFAVTGRPYRKSGPSNHQLTHLLDHKPNIHRISTGFSSIDSNQVNYDGLFTSATNACYTHTFLAKPTDFSEDIRNLLVIKAYELYSPYCNLAPKEKMNLIVERVHTFKWKTNQFEWNEPVGDVRHIEAFLEFRKMKMDELILKRSTVLGI